MRDIRILLLLLDLIFLFHAVDACSCVGMPSGNPPCQAFWSTPVVFSGRVAEIKPIVVDNYERRLVKFTLLEDHRGSAGTIPEVVTGQGGGDCGYSFKLDEEYLVYAYRDSSGRLTTGICTPTKLLSNAKEDLEYIVGLPQAKPVGTISGSVDQYVPRRSDDEYRPPPPLVNVHVTAENKTDRFDVTTDAEGKFHFTDLPPEDYLIRVSLPKDFTGVKERKVTLREKACVMTDFSVARENSLSGRVIAADGGTFKNVLLDLVPVEQINDRHARDRHYVSIDENGRFDFRSMPPGNYYLGIRLTAPYDNENRYPRTFYPGTPLVEDAVPITIREDSSLTGFDFQIPARLAERKIEGQVMFPDGKPAAGAMVIVGEGATIPSRGYAADSDGRFVLTLLEGITYRIKAVVNLPNGAQRHAELVNIPAEGPAKNVKLVLTEPNGNCAKCLQ